MTRPTPRCLFALILIAASTCALRAQGLKGGWHEDTKAGYKIKVPDKWASVPIAVEERWIAAKYIADRPVLAKQGMFMGMEQKPQMRVIVFSDEARKFKPAEVTKVAESKESRTVAYKDAEVPYKDYKDYMKRNVQDGGFYFEKDKETKIGEVPVCQYEIKFEKLTVPRHAITWVFRGDAADYAVEFEVLEDHWEKFEPVFLGCLQSFKFIKRDASNVSVGGSGGTTGSGGVPGGLGDSKREEWKALSAKERADRRKSDEESRFQRAREKVPQGWTVKNSKNFLVISHADQKTTDRMVEAAECCRTWLDKTLGGVSDEYAMRAVIRICADYDEYSAFQQGSGDAWDMNSREIVTYKDANMGTRRSGFNSVFSYQLAQYLRDKDPLIPGYAPYWIRFGLSDAVSGAITEGGTLKLGPDEWEADMLREAQKRGTKMTAKEIMESSPDKLFSSPGGTAYAGRLVRYLLATKKDFVVNYLKASIEVGAEFDKSKAGKTVAAKTEEEEEAQMKARKDDGKKRSAEIIQKVHEKACKWSDKEWQNLNAAFAEYK